MSLILPYSELNSAITPEENAKRLEIVAEIIRTNQQRSIGVTNEIHNRTTQVG